MKPHEETWTVAREGPRFGPRIAFGHTSVAYIALPYRVEGRWFAPDHERGASLARLIAAAPDMARALLALGEEARGVWHTGSCVEYTDGVMEHCHTSCMAAREALRKAGVLP